MTMLEKVARALYRCAPIPNVPFDVLADSDKIYYLGRARAAIEAMREPTLAMNNAALHDYMGYERQGPNKPAWNSKTMWTAMIDAALNEKA